MKGTAPKKGKRERSEHGEQLVGLRIACKVESGGTGSRNETGHQPRSMSK